MIITNIECSVNQQLAGQKKLEQILYKYFTRISLSSLGDTNHDYDVGMCRALVQRLPNFWGSIDLYHY